MRDFPRFNPLALSKTVQRPLVKNLTASKAAKAVKAVFRDIFSAAFGFSFKTAVFPDWLILIPLNSFKKEPKV